MINDRIRRKCGFVDVFVFRFTLLSPKIYCGLDASIPEITFIKWISSKSIFVLKKRITVKMQFLENFACQKTNHFFPMYNGLIVRVPKKTI